MNNERNNLLLTINNNNLSKLYKVIRASKKTVTPTLYKLLVGDQTLVNHDVP